MVIRHKVQGYENFTEFMKTFDSKGKNVHIYFGGSWCLDCILAEPIVEKCLEKADPASHFIHVQVGDVFTWKDPQCPFRKDPKTNLMVIPTLIRWNGQQRLSGSQCKNSSLVEMLFTDVE